MARSTIASEYYLSSEHDLAVNEHYNERVDSLFSPTSGSWIDVHYLRQKDVPSRTSSVRSVGVNPFEESGNSPISDLPRYQDAYGRPGDLVSKEKLSKQIQVTDISSNADITLKVFFIRQKNTFSRISISRELFEHVLATCKTFGRFKEFALCFGSKSRENDICPPPFTFEAGRPVTCGNYGSFECAYGLRYVELNHRGGSQEPWSVRQMAMCQKYNAETASSTWILIAASQKVEKRVDRYIERVGGSRSANPFELHASFIDAALINWRWYIASLIDRVTDQSNRVVLADVGQGKLSSIAGLQINFADRQKLKVLEEKTLDALVILESTIDTISQILDQLKMFSLRCGMDITDDSILHDLQAKRGEADLTRKKVETLYKKVQGTASLLSDLLDYENAQIGHANEVSLKGLAQEARSENAVMRVLAEKNTRDAAAVKVLTVITLIYLPATVVANFFSAQFVSTRALENGGVKLVVASNAWLFAATAIPLTLLTLLVWYSWSQMQGRHLQRQRQLAEKSESPDNCV